MGKNLGGSALDELCNALEGDLLLPGSDGYREAACVANGRYHHILPLAVAKCAGEKDVVVCVKWCQKYGVQPVVRGGGHSYAGLSATEGLMVDIRGLKSVSVDPSTGIATVGGAALNRDIFGKTINTDFILPGGTCLDVGVGGLVLGGGIGYNTHWAGLTCDHLTETRIVTASGEILTANEENHEDLFWACRGGAGGSFGINTSFTFQLAKVPVKELAFYQFEWRGADAATSVLAAFDELLTTAPAAFNGVAMAEARPVEDLGPREAIHTMSRGLFMGSLDDLREIVAELSEITPMSEKQFEMKPFWVAQKDRTSEPEPSHSFGDISRYAEEPLPRNVTEDLVDLLTRCPHRSAEANGSIWSLGWVGGEVVDKFGPTDTAYVHRNMLTLLRPTVVWPNKAPESVGRELQSWCDEMIELIAPHTPNQSYQNFPNRSITDWAEAYYGENLGRLIDVKAAYDGGDLFRNAQSIPVDS